MARRHGIAFAAGPIPEGSGPARARGISCRTRQALPGGAGNAVPAARRPIARHRRNPLEIPVFLGWPETCMGNA